MHSIYWWLIRSYYEPVIHRLEFILAIVFSGISIILFVCYWCVHVEPHLSRSTSGHYEELCGNRLRYRQIIFGVHGSFSRWGRYCLTLPPKYNSFEEVKCNSETIFCCCSIVLVIIGKLYWFIGLHMFYGGSYPRICMMNAKISHTLGFVNTIMKYVPRFLTSYSLSKHLIAYWKIFSLYLNSFVLMMRMTPQHTLFLLMKQKHAIWYPLQPRFISFSACVCPNFCC